MLLFAPLPPVPGPAAIAIAVINIGISIFSLFRGGGLGDVKRALNDLRAKLVETADVLMRFAWKIARGVGWIIQAVHSFWTKVFQPLLEHIARIAQRVNQIVDRVLRPYLEALRRIREAIDLIYNAIFRPVIQMIDTLRRITSLGRLLHIKGAANLDRRLGRLEGKILEPIRQLYRKVSEIGAWMNVLVDARAVLTQAILLGSLYEQRGRWINLHYNVQASPLTDEDRGQLDEQIARRAPGVAEAEFRQYARSGSGPLAADVDAGLEVFRVISKEWEA